MRLESIKGSCKKSHSKVEDIINDTDISVSNNANAIFWSICKDKLPLDDVERYLRNYQDKTETDYRRLLCAFDIKKYGVTE